jgi:hypothetical protein
MVRTRVKQSVFLRAGREDDGQRTFRIIEGEPLPTSHGEDVYRRIFRADVDRVPADLGALQR